MSALKLFVPITKIDVEKRIVYGIATGETPDRSKEICDYASTKPHYEAWSGDISKASGGKSLGNLRAMHGKVAAGKVVAINCNDVEKQIEIAAHVVDDQEWRKVEEGVYTGFSQGGAYAKRWPDETNPEMTRYTAIPSEKCAPICRNRRMLRRLWQLSRLRMTTPNSCLPRPERRQATMWRLPIRPWLAQSKR